jgi:hypothetical protein
LVSLFDKVIMESLFVLANQLFSHHSKSRMEHSAKRIAIINSTNEVYRKIASLVIYIYFSGKIDLNQRIPLL